jgi:hypothetical protein
MIPLHVARRYTGNDFGLPLEPLMDATAAVLNTHSLLQRTAHVAAPRVAPAPVRLLVWTHPLLTAPDTLVHTTVRDAYGPGLTVDARTVISGPRGVLRLALSAHPRPLGVVVTGWAATSAEVAVLEAPAAWSGTAALFASGEAAVLSAPLPLPLPLRARPLLQTTVGALDGTTAAWAVDTEHARLVIWIDAATLARGAVLHVAGA